MLKIENTEVTGWEAAIRGMRIPMNSWDKSDSYHWSAKLKDDKYPKERYEVGDADLNLMKRLAKAGSTDAKYRRMINVTADITAPLYWWKEYDTYKVGTVANSCSTMHKIHAKEFTMEDFSHDHLLNAECPLFEFTWDNGMFARNVQPIDFLQNFIVPVLNICRQKYLETKNKDYWWQMIQLLPSSYNQRRTIQLNYEVLAAIYPKRKDHKLDCWHTFCDWIRSLPYSEIITLESSNGV